MYINNRIVGRIFTFLIISSNIYIYYKINNILLIYNILYTLYKLHVKTTTVSILLPIIFYLMTKLNISYSKIMFQTNIISMYILILNI